MCKRFRRDVVVLFLNFPTAIDSPLENISFEKLPGNCG